LYNCSTSELAAIFRKALFYYKLHYKLILVWLKLLFFKVDDKILHTIFIITFWISEKKKILRMLIKKGCIHNFLRQRHIYIF